MKNLIKATVIVLCATALVVGIGASFYFNTDAALITLVSVAVAGVLGLAIRDVKMALDFRDVRTAGEAHNAAFNAVKAAQDANAVTVTDKSAAQEENW